MPVILRERSESQNLAPAASEPRFTDVPAANQFQSYINWMAQTGITTGYPDNTFRPLNPVSRQAMAAFLYRAITGQTSDFRTPTRASFSDKPVTGSFFREVEWLATTGITTGWPDGTFRPVLNVERQAMAAFLFRAAGCPAFAPPAGATFVDVPAVHQFFREIEWMASTGVTTGWTVEGRVEFRPGAPIERQAMAAFMHRANSQGLFQPAVNNCAGQQAPTPPSAPTPTQPTTPRPTQPATTPTATPTQPPATPTPSPTPTPTPDIPGLLTTNSNGTVPVAGITPDHDGVLVRVSVENAPADLVISGAGGPVMSVTGGRSASTTVLLPLVNGRVNLSASTPVVAEVTALAGFIGNPEVPGSVVTLDQVVTRADTDGAEHAGANISVAPTAVGLVGLGGVPATDVRAAFITATITAPRAGVVEIAGQQFTVRAGAQSVTTIVMPETDGTVPVTFTPTTGSATADLRLDVRGWVPGAAQGTPAANVTGGFVPAASDAVIPDDSAIGVKVIFGAASDVPMQLDVVDLPGEAGSTAPAWIGAFLAANPVASPTSTAPAITIDTPAPGGVLAVDMTEEALRLYGRVTGGVAVERVELLLNNDPQGTAAVTYDLAGTAWLIEGMAPEGLHTITVRVTDRAGRTAQASITIDGAPLDEDDVVLAPGTVVLDATTDTGEYLIQAWNGDTLTLTVAPNFAPGYVIVAGVTPETPQGFLRRVESIDLVGDDWIVTTSPALLTDAIWHADVSETVNPLDYGFAVVDENREPAEGWYMVEGDGSAIRGLVAPPGPLAIAEGGGYVGIAPARSLFSQGIDLAATFAWSASGSRDYSQADAGVLAALPGQIRASGGVAVTATASASVDVTLNIRIGVDTFLFFPYPVLREFDLIATANAEAGVELAAAFNATWEGDFERKIAGFDLPPVKFYVGIPIYVTSHIGAYIEGDFELTGEANLTLSASVGRTWQYGITYRRGTGLDTINETFDRSQPLTFGDGHGVTAAVGLEAGFGPKLVFSIMLYDAIGPEFTLGVRCGVEASWSGDWTVTPAQQAAELEIYIQARADGAVVVQVPILGWEIFRIDLPNIANLRFPITTWCWTPQTGLQRGTLEDGICVAEPELPPVTGVTRISAGGTHSLAVTNSGLVVAWGDGGSGRLGDGESINRLTPVRVRGVGGSGYLENIASVSAGGSHSLALSADGTVYAWGDGRWGRLGDGGSVNRLTPVRVRGAGGSGYLENIVAISAGGSHSLALAADGSVYAWGDGTEGRLGHGGTADRFTPMRVRGASDSAPLADITAVSAGSSHSLALSADGWIYEWGRCMRSTSFQERPACSNFVPTLVGGSFNRDIASISAGGSHSLALANDGSVLAWGSAWLNRWGSGHAFGSTFLSRVSQLDGSVAVSAGSLGSLFLAPDGTVRDSGANVNWRGSGTRRVPGVGGSYHLAGIVAISEGGDHALAVSSVGMVYAWGAGGSGRLGNGITSGSSIPIRVRGINGIGYLLLGPQG